MAVGGSTSVPLLNGLSDPAEWERRQAAKETGEDAGRGISLLVRAPRVPSICVPKVTHLGEAKPRREPELA